MWRTSVCFQVTFSSSASWGKAFGLFVCFVWSVHSLIQFLCVPVPWTVYFSHLCLSPSHLRYKEEKQRRRNWFCEMRHPPLRSGISISWWVDCVVMWHLSGSRPTFRVSHLCGAVFLTFKVIFIKLLTAKWELKWKHIVEELKIILKAQILLYFFSFTLIIDTDIYLSFGKISTVRRVWPPWQTNFSSFTLLKEKKKYEMWNHVVFAWDTSQSES